MAPQAQDQMVLKAADVHPAGYPNVVAVENMGKKLDAATNGEYKLQMFPGGVLGAEKEMVEQTQVGAIQIARISLGPLGPVVPEVNVFNMPFVFRDEAHMREVIDGPIGQELLDKITASPARLVGLAWMDGGSRSLYTKKPVRKTDDLKGQKIRMMGNPLFVDTMNAMGGNGISMGYGEVFSALQTGVIDGAENNPPSLFTANHFKAGTKYYTQTNHLIIPEILVMSKVTWDKLTPAEQALVKKSRARRSSNSARCGTSSGGRLQRQAQGRRRRVDRDGQQAVLRRHRAGARQVRRAVRRPDEAHRRRQVTRAAPAAGQLLTSLTRSLAVELGREGITVNCICPGPIRTAITDRIPEDHKAIYAKRRTALGRYGEPEEVAHMTLSLCLPAASFLTGAVIAVDGGLMARNA